MVSIGLRRGCLRRYRHGGMEAMDVARSDGGCLDQTRKKTRW